MESSQRTKTDKFGSDRGSTKYLDEGPDKYDTVRYIECGCGEIIDSIMIKTGKLDNSDLKVYSRRGGSGGTKK